MLVVLLTLVGGSFLLLGAYEGQLVDNLDVTLEQQVADRATLLENGGSKGALVTVLQDEAFVWIGTRNGEVIAQGGAIFPLENPVPEAIGTTVDVSLLVEERRPNKIEQERMVLRLASAEISSGEVVLAGSELESIDRTVAGLAKLFAIAVPVMVVIVGALAWFITGRALQPVAAIRTQAEAISGLTLTERVPVPDSHDEIEDLAVTVNQMLDRLESHDTAIRQFSSDASHELKSPVANIRAMVETRSSTDPSWEAARQSLVNETNRLGDLVDNLLFLASHQDHDRPRERTAVQLDELIFAEAELISETTPLRVDLSDIEPATIGGSAADLSRLLRNLVDNAARHAEQRIAFSLKTTSLGVRLSIADDGDGVMEQDREKIFERFTRLDEARARDDGGTGLGLSIVAQVARAHGASIEVSEAELGGAAFTVMFPRFRGVRAT
jgi:signal transduction histidine kinase